MVFEYTKDRYEGSGFQDKPLAKEGTHIAIVREVSNCIESKRTPGNYFYIVEMESIEDGGVIKEILSANATGDLVQDWKGQGKFNNLCEALGFSLGVINKEHMIGMPLGVEIQYKNSYCNIMKTWRANDEEKDRAATYDIQNGGTI